MRNIFLTDIPISRDIFILVREVGEKLSNQTVEIAIAGGVIGATLIALYFVPSAYYLLKLQSRKNQFSVRANQVHTMQPKL